MFANSLPSFTQNQAAPAWSCTIVSIYTAHRRCWYKRGMRVHIMMVMSVCFPTYFTPNYIIAIRKQDPVWLSVTGSQTGWQRITAVFFPHISCQRHYQLLHYCCLVMWICFVGHFSLLCWAKDLFRYQTVNNIQSTSPRSMPQADSFTQTPVCFCSASDTTSGGTPEPQWHVAPRCILNLPTEDDAENWHRIPARKGQCEWG